MIQEEVRIIDALPDVAGRSLEEMTDLFPTGMIEWWAALQHHGVPTRLLDWTRDPLVAAYFACRDHPDGAGAVWVLHVKTLQEGMKDRYHRFRCPERANSFFFDPEAAPEVYAGHVLREVRRAEIQSGEFVWCRRVDAIHCETIDELVPTDVPDGPITHERWLIPPDLKPAMLRELRDRAITEDALFPGEDGERAAILELAAALERRGIVERYR